MRHYHRWERHGDPLGGRTQVGDAAAFVETALRSATDECIEWPFGCNSHGYGHILRRGAHAVVCERAHGARPSPLHEVAHCCGVRSCVNPRHLRWATRVENNRDKYGHGTMARRAPGYRTGWLPH